MVRLSKPARDRSVSRKRPRLSGKKGPSITSPVKTQINALDGAEALRAFIPKVS